jgi:TPR repeat protein
VAGYGVDKDFNQAIYWTKLAAEQGDMEGVHALAWCYQQGVGTEINHHKAFELWLESARNGLADSMYAVASCLFKGTG